MTDEPRHNDAPTDDHEEPPPILGSWTRLYTAVLVHLGIWILILYCFTARFHLPS